MQFKVLYNDLRLIIYNVIRDVAPRFRCKPPPLPLVLVKVPIIFSTRNRKVKCYVKTVKYACYFLQTYSINTFRLKLRAYVC